jgi:hypothetical protein
MINSLVSRASMDILNTISVEWGYEQHCCPVTDAEWILIVQGKSLIKKVPYSYEGQEFISEWLFNSKDRGSLYVTYDDSAVGFDGSLADATIILGGVATDWSFDAKSGN